MFCLRKIKVLGVIAAFLLPSSLVIAEQQHEGPAVRFTPAQTLPTIPERPTESAFNFGREGLNIQCPSASGAGALNADLQGLNAFYRWGCDTSRQMPTATDNRTVTVCGVHTDYHVADAHFLYATGSTMFLCALNSAPGSQHYDITFRNQLSPENSIYCRANPNVREIFAGGTDNFFAFQSDRLGETLETRFTGEEAKGWFSCQHTRNPGSFSYAGACSVNRGDFNLDCSVLNGNVNGRCDARLGNCTVGGGYQSPGNWTTRLGLAENAGFLECSGNRGGLQNLSSRVYIPMRRLEGQCRMGVDYSPTASWGAGIQFILPRATGFLNYSGRHGSANTMDLDPESRIPTESFLPSMPPLSGRSGLFNFGVQFKY